MRTQTYANGNCLVTMDTDTGTKIRAWEGIAAPLFPESMDLKITDYCDAGCGWCHEKSTKRGLHAKRQDILRMVEGLPPGVELAIGGGNPMSHPDLFLLLNDFKKLGLIANITINMFHVREFLSEIESLRKHRLIRGVGVSFDREILKKDRGEIDRIFDQNTVLHMIAGLHSVQDLKLVPTTWKILFLGYKDFGFGTKFKQHEPIEARLAEWRYWLGTVLRTYGVSFDNLGIEQLGVRNWLDGDKFDQWFMGHDGEFTMYVDAVRMEFAKGSTAVRQPINDLNIRSCFGLVSSDHHVRRSRQENMTA